MAFTKEINRLLFGMLLIFFMVIASASYWAVVGADSILLRDDNPRTFEQEASIQRGAIYDRNDTLLAMTVPNENGVLDREYYVPSTYSIVGYYSLRYGTGAVESAYDDYLRGELDNSPIDAFVEQDLLHRPQQGADIRLTLDNNLQDDILAALEGYQGAAIVMSVPDGEILGLVSLPTYDPNTLDADWENLVAAEGNPFFNRVLQGQYQPGGMLQTPLMVAGILTQQRFDIITADANRPLMIDDVRLECAADPQDPDLTYTEAYAHGCPFPFSLLANQLSAESLSNIFGAFQLENPPILEGFTINEQVEVTETPEEPLEELNLLEEIVGQGRVSINPLRMATIAAAVINGGNAPQPTILDSYRLPNDDIWQENVSQQTTTPLMTVNAARRLRELMANNMQIGASTPAFQTNFPMGGHTALAAAGDETQAWFIGYVSLTDQSGVAIALVLEDTDDASLAAEAGGQILQSAVNSLQQATD